jgi:hypothetical protein
MPKIETTMGTMEAEAWHIGKMVAADPSGYNWRIANEQVDLVLDALKNYGGWTFRLSERATVALNNFPDKLHIIAEDDGHFTETVLTQRGRAEFFNVLWSVKDRENVPTIAEYRKMHEANLKGR